MSMNPMRLRRLFVLGIFILIVIIIITISFGNAKSGNSNSKENEVTNNNSYSFNETVDLDNFGTDDGTSEFGTDSPDYGLLNEYYDNTDYFFEDRDLHVQSFDGHDIISEEWKNEGYGALINKPKFGIIEKFILSANQASARYNDVKMNDVVSYIKELKEQGFNNVVKDLRNNKADLYIFSAKKGDNTVTLDYEKGSLLIVIF